MLVLSRKVGERIMINENITITVVDIKGDSVRLSFDAPKEIKIYRGEIYDSIAAENAQAAMPKTVPGFDVLKGIHKEK